MAKYEQGAPVPELAQLVLDRSPRDEQAMGRLEVFEALEPFAGVILRQVSVELSRWMRTELSRWSEHGVVKME